MLLRPKILTWCQALSVYICVILRDDTMMATALPSCQPDAVHAVPLRIGTYIGCVAKDLLKQEIDGDIYISLQHLNSSSYVSHPSDCAKICGQLYANTTYIIVRIDDKIGLECFCASFHVVLATYLGPEIFCNKKCHNLTCGGEHKFVETGENLVSFYSVYCISTAATSLQEPVAPTIPILPSLPPIPDDEWNRNLQSIKQNLYKNEVLTIMVLLVLILISVMIIVLVVWSHWNQNKISSVKPSNKTEEFKYSSAGTINMAFETRPAELDLNTNQNIFGDNVHKVGRSKFYDKTKDVDFDMTDP